LRRSSLAWNLLLAAFVRAAAAGSNIFMYVGNS
jgi:hypothetical protein